jgi:acetate kinase
MSAARALLSGSVEGIGGFARHEYDYRHGHGRGTSHTVNHGLAFEQAMTTLDLALPSLGRVEGTERSVSAVGHLLPLAQPSEELAVVVDDSVQQELGARSDAATADPETIDGSFSVLEQARGRLPDVPHVAVFDDLGAMATSREVACYAIRTAATGEDLVARLGRGGLRLRSVVGHALSLLGDFSGTPRIVVVDLDEVCHVVGLKGWRVIETTHEFDGTSRLVSERGPGAVSPGLRRALADAHPGEEVDEMLASRCGLSCIEDRPLTMSGLAASIQEGSYGPASRMLFGQIIREVGGQITLLGGVDALVFTGSTGAASPAVRSMLAARMRIFQVLIDEQANEQASGPTDITGEGGRIRVLVVPQDSSWQVALETVRLSRDGD